VNLQADSNKQLMQRRLNLFYVPIIAVAALLAVRLWQLQILNGAEYTLLAEKNRIRTIQVVAPRGTITDRRGTPLVENRPSFNILLYRESVANIEATAAFVTAKLGVTLEDFSAILSRNRGMPLYHPIVIKEDVGIDDISVVEAHKQEHPELQMDREPRRLYRYGAVGAHVVGYVSEVSADELAKGTFPGARVGSLVGKFGVERTYNERLTGDDGSRVVLVDSLGREVGLLEEVDSVIGDNLQLTLDLDLQTTAENLLEGKVGAIVAMDPRNGEILALASSPSFDPNSFSTRISRTPIRPGRCSK
jgi:penicillin-binding protein 2